MTDYLYFLPGILHFPLHLDVPHWQPAATRILLSLPTFFAKKEKRQKQ
jgi:hypothetical protein